MGGIGTLGTVAIALVSFIAGARWQHVRARSSTPRQLARQELFRTLKELEGLPAAELQATVSELVRQWQR